MLNYVILTTHSSHYYAMWDFTHMCSPTFTRAAQHLHVPKGTK